MQERKPKFSLGDKFIVRRGKRGKIEYTVEDIYSTYDCNGKLVKLRYVCSSHFLGQNITDYDVPETTLARADKVG